jgi:hypothetical protein
LGYLIGKHLLRGFSWLQSKVQGSDTVAPTNPEKWRYQIDKATTATTDQKNSQKLLNMLYLRKQEIKTELNLTFFSPKNDLLKELEDIKIISNCVMVTKNYNSLWNSDGDRYFKAISPEYQAYVKKINSQFKNQHKDYYLDNLEQQAPAAR